MAQNKSYNNWTQSEIKNLQEMAESGKYTFKEIGDKLGRGYKSIQSQSSRLGIKNKHKYTLYKVDDEFFKIPNPINCYYSGYIAADGWVNSKKSFSGEPNSIKLELGEKDYQVLQTYKNYIQYTGNIEKCFKKDSDSINYAVEVSCASRWGYDLKRNFGITNRKTNHIPPPNIDDEYLKFCYLIGYLDGDGTVCLTERKSVGTVDLNIKVTSNSFKIVNWIREFINKYFKKLRNRKDVVYEYKDIDHYVFLVCGLRGYTLFDYLKQFPLPKLERKWNRPEIEKIIEEKRKQYPKFFNKDHLPKIS